VVIQEACVRGISNRSVDDLVKAMGMSGISKSQVSRLCEKIDEKVQAFLERRIAGDWPYIWIDATALKVRRGGRIVSVAVIIAVGVNADGRREVLGMEIGTSSIVRRVGALLLEQNDEWAVQRARYMTLETISQISDESLASLPIAAR
jgi:transposase-like protein